MLPIGDILLRERITVKCQSTTPTILSLIWIQTADNLMAFLKENSKEFFEIVNSEKIRHTTNQIREMTQHAKS